MPGELVKLLHGKNQDPFPALLERLDAVGCDRKRLRPESPLLGREGDAALKARVTELAGQSSGRCKEALEDLFGVK